MPQKGVMDLRLLLAAEDDERRDLERSLHDGVQQRLIALAVTFQLVLVALETAPHEAAAYLAEGRTNAQEAIDDLRGAVLRIHPPLLDTQGLAAALTSAASNRPTPAKVEGVVTEPLPPEVAVTAYRVCVAALAGTENGARAVVHVRTTGSELVFEVAVTDGAIDSSAVLRLDARVRALGGVLSLSPNRVAGQLPLTTRDRPRDT
jgi:signal transduction histidine kinase